MPWQFVATSEEVVKPAAVKDKPRGMSNNWVVNGHIGESKPIDISKAKPVASVVVSPDDYCDLTYHFQPASKNIDYFRNANWRYEFQLPLSDWAAYTGLPTSIVFVWTLESNVLRDPKMPPSFVLDVGNLLASSLIQYTSLRVGPSHFVTQFMVRVIGFLKPNFGRFSLHAIYQDSWQSSGKKASIDEFHLCNVTVQANASHIWALTAAPTEVDAASEEGEPGPSFSCELR